MKSTEHPDVALIGVFVCPDVLSGKKPLRRIHCIKKLKDEKAFVLSCGSCVEESCEVLGLDSFRSSYPELTEKIKGMQVGDMWLLTDTEQGEKWLLQKRSKQPIKPVDQQQEKNP